MVGMRASVGWCRSGAPAAWTVPPLLIAGLLFVLCTSDVAGDAVQHDGNCSIEAAAVAVAIQAPAPTAVATGAISIPSIVVPLRWLGITASPITRLHTNRRAPQQPRAPPSLAIVWQT